MLLLLELLFNHCFIFLIFSIVSIVLKLLETTITAEEITLEEEKEVSSLAVRETNFLQILVIQKIFREKPQEEIIITPLN